MSDTHLSGPDPEFLLDRIASKILEKICCWQQPVKTEYAKRGKLLVLAYYPDGRQSQQRGRPFSDQELRIIHLFESNGNTPLNKKEICEALGWKSNTDTRTLIENLSDRAGGRAVLEETDDARFRLKDA